MRFAVSVRVAATLAATTLGLASAVSKSVPAAFGATLAIRTTPAAAPAAALAPIGTAGASTALVAITVGIVVRARHHLWTAVTGFEGGFVADEKLVARRVRTAVIALKAPVHIDRCPFGTA